LKKIKRQEEEKIIIDTCKIYKVFGEGSPLPDKIKKSQET
jgi:hypothetical protein